MRVLVTGASGFLGYHLCRYFLAKGYEVVGLDIAEFDYPDIKSGIKFVKGDIYESRYVVEAMERVDVVVHCAAALPLWREEDIWRTNGKGTYNVLRLAYELGIERVVYISSTAVYGIPQIHPVDENYPLKGVGAYGESKIDAEESCVYFRGKGMCVPILRPKTFAGAMRLGVFQILCQWVMEGRNIPIIGNGRNRYQLLHIDDLVQAIYMVSVAPKDLANDTYNVGAVEFGTIREDLQALLDYAGFGKRVVCIPSWMAIPALKMLERFGLSPLYEWVYETAGKEHYVSVDRIREKIGWFPVKSTADVWIDTYKWYAENYANKKAEVGISHRVAWEQGILKLVKRAF